MLIALSPLLVYVTVIVCYCGSSDVVAAPVVFLVPVVAFAVVLVLGFAFCLTDVLIFVCSC